MIKELTEKEEIEYLKSGLNYLGSKYENMTLDELEEKWIAFSNIQQANFLIVTEEGLRRFITWMETGKDEDAWS